MNRTIIFILIAGLFLTLSCKQQGRSRNVLLPKVSGNAYDVVVVMDPAKWNSGPGEETRHVLYTIMPGLPQEEPMFDIVDIPHNAFDKVFKQQRNIIVANIDKQYSEEKLVVKKDLWANTQLLINIFATDDSSFINLVNANEDEILNLLNEVERQRLMSNYKKNRSKHVYEKIKEDYLVLLNVPEGYKVNRSTPDFLWLQHEYPDLQKSALVTMSVCIYQYPYLDENTFTKGYLVNKRNEFMKKYIKGKEVESSYVTTEERYPVSFSEYELQNGKYTAELRGLWKMQGGIAMGGPFVSISQLDEVNNRVVTVEGFVFAPGVNKRNLVHQLEAILYSLNFPVKNE